jgi:hypothetical protein
VELYSQAGSSQVWLQNYAVTVLVPFFESVLLESYGAV